MSQIKARLTKLEQRQPITGGAYTFQDFHKIPFTAEVQARFKALYTPAPNGGRL